MRHFVGRAMLWLVMLAVCATGAMAEGSMFDFNTAPGEDDVQTGWYIENEIYCQVCLVKEGQQIPVSSFCINVPEEGDYILRLYTADFKYRGLSRGRAAGRYAISFGGLVDLISFLPVYLPFFFPSGAAAFETRSSTSGAVARNTICS